MIPEQLLVAFAAIEEYEPAWIRDRARFEIIEKIEERKNLGTLPLLEGLEGGEMASIPILSQLRAAYFQLSSELKDQPNDSKQIPENLDAVSPHSAA